MERREIETLARQLMNKHGLNLWGFGWCSDKTTVGWCYHGRRQIEFSIHFTEMSDFDIEQTILHEIAHALVGAGEGHGPVWKAKGREIGYVGGRCCDTEVQPESKYIGVCPAGHEMYKHRRTEAVITERFYCIKCPKSIPEVEKKFRFYLTPEYRRLGTSATLVSGYQTRWLNPLPPKNSVLERLNVMRPSATVHLANTVVESVPTSQSRRRDYDEGTPFIDWN